MQPSVPHIQLHESARCKYKTNHVWVTKSMDAVTAGDHWLRSRHCLWLQLPLPLSLMPVCSSHSQWICKGCAGFWSRDGGRLAFKTTEWSGSASNARGEARYNATHWVCLWGFSGCWCATTACTQYGSWCNHWLSLCRRQDGSHGLSVISHARIVQSRWRGEVLTWECTGYRTPSLRGITLASQCDNASLSRVKLSIPWRPTLLLFLNNSYYPSRASVKAFGRHCPI